MSAFYYFVYVLSVHNIYIVVIGVILSLLELNKDFIYNLIKSKRLKKINKDKGNIDNFIKTKSKEIEAYNENSGLSLVETIEELGFIPSIDNNNENKVA